MHILVILTGGGGGGDNNALITPSDNPTILQESSTDFDASKSNSQSTSFVDSTSIDSTSIDSLQNSQNNSLDLAESKHNNSTKSKKSKRYNKLTKNTDKYDSKYDNIEAKQLDKVVVTASGYEQDIKNAPATISIIPREEILSRPIRDLGDAVQDVPGVSVEMQKQVATLSLCVGLARLTR